MDSMDTLISIAVDLTAALSTKDRYLHLLEALEGAIPYDAAALLRVDGEILIPAAARGLSPDAMGRYYARKDHPRLENVISRAALKASSGLHRGERVIIHPNHLDVDFSSENRHTPALFEKSPPDSPEDYSLREATQRFQIQTIHRALMKNNGNWAAAARDLGMDRSNLHNLSKRLGLKQKQTAEGAIS